MTAPAPLPPPFALLAAPTVGEGPANDLLRLLPEPALAGPTEAPTAAASEAPPPERRPYWFDL